MSTPPKKICIIGAGFAGLSAASHLAKQGNEVFILEKNTQAGGRARQFENNGFVFDMGPSWYWMPDVFERYFKMFDHSVSDFYELIRLDPSYRIFFEDNHIMDVPAIMSELEDLFERYEKGSSRELKDFLKDSQYKYEVGMQDLVFKPGLSILEFADRRVMSGLFKMHLFSSISDYIRKKFSDTRLIRLLEFPVLFLGATPKDTPALYSLMNYADLALGTWYPKGGMHKIVEAMVKVAQEQGVKIHLGETVEGFEFDSTGNISAVRTSGSGSFSCDIVVGGADYEHIDQKITPATKRNYTPKYWDSRKMAPSSLLFYLGVNTRVPGLLHHNLFFDEDFELHAREIYDTPKWPTAPLFYVSCPSVTDESIAPKGKENIFLLIPVAPDLVDNEKTREAYFEKTMNRLEARINFPIRKHIEYKRSYAHSNFKEDYNSFKGNAYGLANTLLQTAILKPSLKSKKIPNLYFTGQLTTPGPGVPPSLISGEVVSKQIAKDYKIQIV